MDAGYPELVRPALAHEVNCTIPQVRRIAKRYALQMNKLIHTILIAASSLLFAAGAQAQVPPAAFKPVAVPGTTSFGATTLDLARFGYVEEEFYISGAANRYRIANPLGTAEVIDGGQPYITYVYVCYAWRAASLRTAADSNVRNRQGDRIQSAMPLHSRTGVCHRMRSALCELPADAAHVATV